MMNKLIAALVAVSFVAGVAGTASAHRPNATKTSTSTGFDGKTFWDQQTNQGGQ